LFVVLDDEEDDDDYIEYCFFISLHIKHRH